MTILNTRAAPRILPAKADPRIEAVQPARAPPSLAHVLLTRTVEVRGRDVPHRGDSSVHTKPTAEGAARVHAAAVGPVAATARRNRPCDRPRWGIERQLTNPTTQ